MRSDSVTTPTRDMKDAMRDITLGDNEFGEDVTVQGMI